MTAVRWIAVRWAKALIVAVALFFAAPAARAADTVIAGGVSSASANLWPIYIGIRKGFFAEADIAVDLVFSPSNSATIQQIVVNAINVSIGSGLVDPIRAIEKGAPVAILRIEVRRPPYALLGQPSIKDMKALVGKIVSVGGAKDITRLFLDRMLVASGVDPKRVDLIFAGATSARYSALQSGAAQAAMLTAPYNFDAIAAGFTNLGLTADYVDMPFSGVATNRTWAMANISKLRRFLAVYTKSIAVAARSRQSARGRRHHGVGEPAQGRGRRARLRLPGQRRLLRADGEDFQGEARQGRRCLEGIGRHPGGVRDGTPVPPRGDGIDGVTPCG